MDTAAVKSVFRNYFEFTPVQVVHVPGSVEVLGSYADSNEGLALTAAVNRFLFLAFSPRTDGRIELVSPAFPHAHKFWISKLTHDPAAPWADYVKGMLAQLRRRGVHFNGFNAAIHSTIPAGMGMGSSAALTIATALAVRQLFPYSLTELGAGVPPRRDRRGGLPPLPVHEKMILARLCRAAEIEFAGVTSSLVAPLSSLFGKAHHLMNIDCRFHSVDHTPLIGETLVVCDSGVRPSTGATAFAALREHCELAARTLRAGSLRSVDAAWLKANRISLNHREYECAYHVVGEIQRVVHAERALREDDHRQFGQYLLQSHESSRDLFRNSCPELDLLVKLARAHPACLGARLSGAGFGGATVNLVAYHMASDFMQTIARQFETRTGQKLSPMVCQITDGAG